MLFQFSFSLLMQFQFISVYCLFFVCKDTIRREGGLGNRGGSNYMCPNYISGNGRNRKTGEAVQIMRCLLIRYFPMTAFVGSDTANETLVAKVLYMLIYSSRVLS